jgi:hypothetical protein
MANKLWITTIWDDGKNYQYLSERPLTVWIPFYESDDENAEFCQEKCSAENYQKVFAELDKKYEIALGGVEIMFCHKGKKEVIQFGSDNSTARDVDISAEEHDMPEGVYAGQMRTWKDGQDPYDSLAEGWY